MVPPESKYATVGHSTCDARNFRAPPGKIFFPRGSRASSKPYPRQAPDTRAPAQARKGKRLQRDCRGRQGGARLSRPVVRAEGRRAATEATKLPAQWLHWPAGFGPLRRPVDHISSFRVATACSRSLSAPASSFGSALIDRPLEAAQQLAGCRVPIITVVRVVLVALG